VANTGPTPNTKFGMWRDLLLHPALVSAPLPLRTCATIHQPQTRLQAPHLLQRPTLHRRVRLKLPLYVVHDGHDLVCLLRRAHVLPLHPAHLRAGRQQPCCLRPHQPCGGCKQAQGHTAHQGARVLLRQCNPRSLHPPHSTSPLPLAQWGSRAGTSQG